MKRFVVLYLLLWVSAKGESPQEFFEKGSLALGDSDFASAEAFFKRSLESGAAQELKDKVVLGLADVNFEKKDFAGAIWILSKVALSGGITSERPRVLFRLAEAHMANGNEASGMSTYARFATEFPKNPDAPVALTFLANYAILREVNPKKAVELFEKVAKQYPGTPEAENALSILPSLRKTSAADIRKQLAEEARAATKSK